MSIVLTDEQDELCGILYKWLKNWSPKKKPYYSYSGPPGSGKTTIIREIMKSLGIYEDEVLCMAYVGNAVMNLLRSGMYAKTIHSSIYDVKMVPVEDEDGNYVKDNRGKVRYEMKFVLKDEIQNSPKLLVVDESGMVPDSMIKDILAFDIPVIFLGDKHQLGPVYGRCAVMENPDYSLTKIMRQAEGDPIVEFCQDILHNRPIAYGDYGKSKVLKEIEMGSNLLNDYDMILCGKNKTKETMNSFIREKIMHLHPKKPYVGDKIICRQNDWTRELNGFFLVNGMSGTIEDINWSASNGKRTMIDFKPSFLDDYFYDVPMDAKYLNLPADQKKDYGFSVNCKFDYGYAITTHLSQGSQYNRVLFIDEYFRDYDFMQRLRYTAVSRAIDSVHIINTYPQNNPHYYMKWC